MDNTGPIVVFLLWELARPCMILSQEACDELLDHSGKVVPRETDINSLRSSCPTYWRLSQYWRGFCTLVGPPKRTPSCWWHPYEEYFESSGNPIFLEPWKGDKNDTLLENELSSYIKRLVCHPGTIPFQPNWILSFPTQSAIGLSVQKIKHLGCCSMSNSINLFENCEYFVNFYLYSSCWNLVLLHFCNGSMCLSRLTKFPELWSMSAVAPPHSCHP